MKKGNFFTEHWIGILSWVVIVALVIFGFTVIGHSKAEAERVEKETTTTVVGTILNVSEHWGASPTLEVLPDERTSNATIIVACNTDALCQFLKENDRVKVTTFIWMGQQMARDWQRA